MESPGTRSAAERRSRTHKKLVDLVHGATTRATGSTTDEATLLEMLARLDPAAAASWLAAHPEGVERSGRGLSADALVRIAGALPEAERHAAPARARMRQGIAREPSHPQLLRLAARAAAASGDWPEADALLGRLGRVEPTQATLQYIWRARQAMPSTGGSPVRLALLSSFTIDPLVPYIDLECRLLGLEPRIHVAPFNTWAQEIIDDSSELRRFTPQVTFLALALDDLVPELAGTMRPEDLVAAGETVIDRVLGAARQFTTWADGMLVVHGFYATHPDPAGVAAWHDAGGRAAWLAGLNVQLATGLAELPRVYFLDVGDVLLRRAGGALDNPKLRQLAAMRLCERPLGDLARAYASFIAPYMGLTRKCVVLDLDNTLWGGIVGEDGPHGVKLGDTAPGVEFVEFQHYLCQLAERGFLLAINSKNNPADALEVIRQHESMILHEEAFSAVRINWRPKPENMLGIAEELNIGVESLIFVDDNPEERELMRQLLPAVLTPELPPDPSRFRATLEALPQLQKLVVTGVDRSRTDLYRANRQRQEARVEGGSLTDYLRSLDIAVRIEPANEATLPRVHQLFERTNQFNLTTRRHSAAKLAAAAAVPEWRLYTARVADRFGDHGLVATALVRVAASHWRIDSFLMSCRVIGYGIETALLAAVSDAALAHGASELVGELIETAKNVPARDLYARHDFVREEESDGEAERWRCDLTAGGIPCPDWIQATISTQQESA